MQILFPVQDRKWLGELIKKSQRERRWFARKVEKPRLDIRLTASFDFWHEPNFDLRRLTSRRELFSRFQYWAVRLNAIYEEAEDPTPTTRIGRWAERRKAARHTFWLTVLGFTVAIFFGIAATVLAAVQVWIGYCDWKGQISAACR
jgi:hypothetical protein